METSRYTKLNANLEFSFSRKTEMFTISKNKSVSDK